KNLATLHVVIALKGHGHCGCAVSFVHSFVVIEHRAPRPAIPCAAINSRISNRHADSSKPDRRPAESAPVLPEIGRIFRGIQTPCPFLPPRHSPMPVGLMKRCCPSLSSHPSPESAAPSNTPFRRRS